MPYKPPSPRYVGPPAHSTYGQNKPIQRIVIHSTVSECRPGMAESIAEYFKSDRAGGSAHYVVDPTETIQAAYDSVICWHAPPNQHSIGIEMCDNPGVVPSAAPGSKLWDKLRSAWRWNNKYQKQMLKRTAKLTAQLCLAYDVPIQFLSPTKLKNGASGITTHNNVSEAWGQSTHWDPGWWPRRKFIRMVQDEAGRIRRNHA